MTHIGVTRVTQGSIALHIISTGEQSQTRTPAFWDTPAAPWLPILVIHIRSQVKTGQSQSYKLKKIAKNTNFEILQETSHATHLLKLLDKMCKYEMDPTKTAGATERTRDAGRTDGQSETSIPPPTTSLCWGIITLIIKAYVEWLLFCRRHIQSSFPEWKLLCFDLNFTETCSQGSN